jgi:23S rRNA (uracil747-C5)-methyltransferase
MAVGGVPGAIHFGYTTRDLITRDITACPLASTPIQRLLGWLRVDLSERKIAPYDVKNSRGELKFVLIKMSESSGELLVRFVLRSEAAVPHLQELIPVMQQEFPQIKVVSVNLQPEHKAIIEGDREIVLTSDSYIKESFGGRVLFFGTQTFTQVNSAVAERLYTTVASAVEQLKPKLFFDLYCGVGAFGILCAMHTEKVLGIEYSAPAIAAAIRGAQENEFKNTEFLSGDVEEFLTKYRGPLPEVVVVNPPRRGLSPRIIEILRKMRPQILFYSSCNPETLRRDAELLNATYRLKEITPFDMFPLTEHLEVLAVFECRNVPDL